MKQPEVEPGRNDNSNAPTQCSYDNKSQFTSQASYNKMSKTGQFTGRMRGARKPLITNMHPRLAPSSERRSYSTQNHGSRWVATLPRRTTSNLTTTKVHINIWQCIYNDSMDSKKSHTQRIRQETSNS